MNYFDLNTLDKALKLNVGVVPREELLHRVISEIYRQRTLPKSKRIQLSPEHEELAKQVIDEFIGEYYHNQAKMRKQSALKNLLVCALIAFAAGLILVVALA